MIIFLVTILNPLTITILKMKYVPIIIIAYSIQNFVRTILGFDSFLSFIYVISIILSLIFIRLKYPLKTRIEFLIIIGYFLILVFSFFNGQIILKQQFDLIRVYILPLLLTSLLILKTNQYSNLAKVYCRYFIFIVRVVFIWQTIELLIYSFLPSYAEFFTYFSDNEILYSATRPLGFFFDFQTSIFLLSLFFLISVFRNHSTNIFLLTPILFLSNMKTWLFSLLISLLFYYTPNLIRSLFKLKFKNQILVAFVFIVLLFSYVGYRYYMQFVNPNLSGLLILNNFLSDKDIILQNIPLIASGPFDYSNTISDNNIIQAIFKNEIGWLRVIYELGIIPTIIFTISFCSMIKMAIPNNGNYSNVILFYIGFGALHHLTFLNIGCAFFIVCSCMLTNERLIDKNNISLLPLKI